MVKWINDEEEVIRISGAETVCLMIKGWHGTWKKYFEDNMRSHVHSSFIVDGAKLYAFEKDNKIKFQIKDDEVTHYTHAKRAPK